MIDSVSHTISENTPPRENTPPYIGTGFVGHDVPDVLAVAACGFASCQVGAAVVLGFHATVKALVTEELPANSVGWPWSWAPGERELSTPTGIVMSWLAGFFQPKTAV